MPWPLPAQIFTTVILGACYNFCPWRLRNFPHPAFMLAPPQSCWRHCFYLIVLPLVVSSKSWQLKAYLSTTQPCLTTSGWRGYKANIQKLCIKSRHHLLKLAFLNICRNFRSMRRDWNFFRAMLLACETKVYFQSPKKLHQLQRLPWENHWEDKLFKTQSWQEGY